MYVRVWNGGLLPCRWLLGWHLVWIPFYPAWYWLLCSMVGLVDLCEESLIGFWLGRSNKQQRTQAVGSLRILCSGHWGDAVSYGCYMDLVWWCLCLAIAGCPSVFF